MDKKGRRNVNDPLDTSLNKPRQDVSLSAFAYLFSEMVQYSLTQVRAGHQLEDRLHEMGTRVGHKTLDLVTYRERLGKRNIRVVSVLQSISGVCWRSLFGHSGELLKGQDNENEYYINDKQMLPNKFISVPRDYAHVNCGAFAAGIVEGILCSAEFPAEVSAHNVDDGSTTILIRFLPEVMARERAEAARDRNR
eukprot:Selendium_serpulae@DN5590_c2_g1_i2.p1